MMWITIFNQCWCTWWWTQMYGDQSGVNFIVIFYTKNFRIKWSNITRFHEFCTKCFAGHSIMLVLWSFRSGTGLEYIFSPFHEEHNYFSFVESGKICGARGEFKIYKETSHRPRTGKHVCIPQVRHSHKKFSSFLQNNLSEYRLPPPLLQLHRLQNQVQPLQNFIKLANMNND